MAVEIDQNTSRLNLGNAIDYFCDESNSLNYPQALTHSYEKLPAGQISFGYYPHPCWFRFTLKNVSDEPLPVIILFEYSLTDKIEIYHNQNGQLEVTRIGDNLPFENRPLKIRLNTERLLLKPNEETTVHVRVHTSSTLTLPISVSSEAEFFQSSFHHEWLLGIFYGISLGLMAYNLFLFISTRELANFYYVLHVLGVTAFFTTMDGISYQWWPSASAWQNISVNVFAYTAMIFGLLFAKEYLNLRANTKLNRIINVPLYFLIGCLLGLLILPGRANAMLLPLSGIIAMSTLMAVGLIRLKQGFLPARFFVLAWIVFLTMVLAVALNAFGIIHFLPLALYGLKFGFVSQQVLLSVGMGNRINQLKEAMLSSRQAQIEARAESRAKSDFLAKMSHEIRTPMNGVLGMVQLLKDTPLNSSQAHYVNTIYGSGQALLGVINDILDYSKIEAGKMQLENITFNLENLLNECASMFTLSADEKGLTLVCSMRPGLPRHIMGDPTRLRQIILNLVSNAFKFTNQGEIIIRAFCEKSAQENNGRYLLRFEVQDSGIGINRNALQNLFQSFQQADTSTTRKYGGTGLGLSISKQLAELMGGNIGVESEEGKGSTFWFTVTAEPGCPTEIEETPNVDLRNKKLLLVDDNPTFCEIMQTELSSWGLRTEVAHDGPSALDILEESIHQHESFDIICVDIDMPGMNGLELCRELHQHTHLKSIPKMLMTAAKLYPNEQDLLDIGVSLIIEKPISSSLLRSAFDQLLNGSANANASNHKKSATRYQPTLKGLKILVADDNSVNQLVIAGMLKKLGADSVVVNNGQEALEQYQNNPSSDAILMDCEMPVLDGLQATEAIRNAEAGSAHIPIIALTAHVLQEQQQKCHAAGMDDHLAKPIDMNQLVEKLKKWAA